MVGSTAHGYAGAQGAGCATPSRVGQSYWQEPVRANRCRQRGGRPCGQGGSVAKASCSGQDQQCASHRSTEREEMTVTLLIRGGEVELHESEKFNKVRHRLNKARKMS